MIRCEKIVRIVIILFIWSNIEKEIHTCLPYLCCVPMVMKLVGILCSSGENKSESGGVSSISNKFLHGDGDAHISKHSDTKNHGCTRRCSNNGKITLLLTFQCSPQSKPIKSLCPGIWKYLHPGRRKKSEMENIKGFVSHTKQRIITRSRGGKQSSGLTKGSKQSFPDNKYPAFLFALPLRGGLSCKLSRR